MSTTYAHRQTTAQMVADTKAASLFDSSSQSESLQCKADLVNNAAQRAAPPRPNNTGMPDNLKSGIESLSGFSMDDVRVHYNSSKPATVQALAYTQGTDIHVAPGQEKHLPHEAWHVAQQMAGRVSPTTNINGMPVNDNASFEHEADVMGEKAASFNNKIESKVYENSSSNHCCLQREIDLSESTFSSQIKSINKLTNHETFETDQKSIALSNKSLPDNSDYYIKLKEKTYSDRKKTLEGIADQASSVGGHITSAKTLPEHVYVEFQSSYNTSSKRDGSPKTQNKILLNMVYSYGKEDFPGYVVKVDRSKENKQQDTGKMVEGSKYDLNGKETADALTKYKVDKTSSTKGQNLEQDEYTNCHHKTNSENIFDLTRREKTETGPKNKLSAKNWDAYTKLTGEGARFQCVRRNIEHINDDTVFYPIGQTENDEHGIKFSDLWKTWSKSFNKAYNIPDKDISEKMRTNGNQLTMSNGGPSTSTKALPGNRVKLDGVSTIENEKNFDEELVKLSWKLGLDSSVMDSIQKLGEKERNIVYQMNSQTVLNTYLDLQKESRDKINDLSIKYVEKFISLKDPEKSTFYALDITTKEKQNLLDMNGDQIGKILALEKTLIKAVLALEPGNIGKIISLDSAQLTKFFQVFKDDKRNKIFEWDLRTENIIALLKLEETQINLIFTHCKNANQVINTLSFDFILELAESNFAFVINFDDDLIFQISQFKRAGHDISALSNFYNNPGILKKIFVDLDLAYSSINELVHLTTEQRDKILEFDKDKIDKLFTFNGDNLTTLLNLDSNGLSKILSIPSVSITKFLTDVEEAQRTVLLKLVKDDFCQLIVDYQYKGMKELNSFAKKKRNLKKYKVESSPQPC